MIKKSLFKYALLMVAVCSGSFSLSSCSDDDNNKSGTSLSEGDKFLQKVLAANVDNTINPTYRDMATAASNLYDEIGELLAASKTNSVTQAMVDKACESWKSARAYYENSEAFLLGASSDYKIDPHIDTWPLDLTALYTTLKNEAQIQRLAGEDGASVANGDLGQNLLGFHGVEFILFRDGANRKAEELNSNGHDSYNEDGLNFTNFSGEYELIFAYAVAGDLRNSIYQMETSWNEDAPQEHRDIMDDLEWSSTMPSSDESYGWNMKKAGEAGSTYRTVKNAISGILVGDGGAAGIADEVGLVKIGNPYTGADIHYIESPYSYNSLVDFYDNIQSISNVWNGGVVGNRSNYSFAKYFEKYNAEIGIEVQTAIDNAQAKINAIPKPFVLNYTSPKCQDAINACTALVSALNKANDFIQNTDK